MIGSFPLDYAVNNEAMISLLDEYVLFENLQKFHFVCTVEEEIRSIDDFSCVERDHHDRHHQQIACRNGMRFLSNQNHPLSISQFSQNTSTPHALPGSFHRRWNREMNSRAVSILCIHFVLQWRYFYCFEAQNVIMISLYSSNSK